MKTLVNKKVYVGKFSKEIQEKAFSLGWSWRYYGLNTTNLTNPFLYFHADKTISYGSDVAEFNRHCHKEVTVEWLLDLDSPEKNSLENENIVNFYLDEDGKIFKNFQYVAFRQKWFRQFNSEDEAVAYRRLPELLYWRNKYNDGWKPDWEDVNRIKINIVIDENKIFKSENRTTSHILSFKTKEIRDRFLEDFKELIEIYKPLL